VLEFRDLRVRGALVVSTAGVARVARSTFVMADVCSDLVDREVVKGQAHVFGGEDDGLAGLGYDVIRPKRY
jgi:hypothetical protein